MSALLLPGCQVPPARVAACDRSPPRKAALVRQVVADSVVETAQRPLRSVWTVGSAPFEYSRAAVAGVALKRVGIHLMRPGPLPCDRTVMDCAALEAELSKMCGRASEPALVQLYPDGSQALAALECVIAQARCRLDVLMYIWDNDAVGWRVAQRLAERAGPGLPVRVLVDGGGNLLQGHPKEASSQEVNAVECWLARQPYVEVIRTRDPWLRFDHRKLVVADGRIAFTGGRNFTETSFYRAHDLSFSVEGRLAAELDTVFEDFWQKEGGAPAPALPSVPAPITNASARLVHTGPFEHVLAKAVYLAIDRACHHVYIENPYFADSKLEFKLARARQRGVDVRVLLTRSDESEIVNRSNAVTANRLLRAGVRVYIYPSMLHVKASSVDGVWAYLGTGNFDRLSLRHNYELGLAACDGTVVEELEDVLFQRDFRPEWELRAPFPLTPTDYAREAFFSLFL